jgi:hypothetical protein
LATGRNPWKQASLKDETFRAYLADPDFLLSILPISRELNRILKRIFCIDSMRRISLPELKEKIRDCKYFTRTAEVDRWEHTVQQSRKSRKIATVIELPPSPPSTPPCSSNASSTRSISPAIWQQRIDHIREKQSAAAVVSIKKKNKNPDSILTTMLTTLMV